MKSWSQAPYANTLYPQAPPSPPHVPGTLLHTARKGVAHRSQPALPACLPLRPQRWHPQQLLLPRPSGLRFLLCRPGYSWQSRGPMAMAKTSCERLAEPEISSTSPLPTRSRSSPAHTPSRPHFLLLPRLSSATLPSSPSSSSLASATPLPASPFNNLKLCLLQGLGTCCALCLGRPSPRALPT